VGSKIAQVGENANIVSYNYNPLMSILASMGFVVNIMINFIQPNVAKMKFSTLMNTVGDKDSWESLSPNVLGILVPYGVHNTLLDNWYFEKIAPARTKVLAPVHESH
jgi:hypothetical protein